MGDPSLKPKLSSEDLIERLHNKGVEFNIISKEDALTFIQENNSYFKLTSYRKNYSRVINADGISVYLHLEFAYLVEISRIDMLLRYQLLRMCLDIEHSLKVQIVRMIEMNQNEDGYSIVNDFLALQQKGDINKVADEIKRNYDTTYYHGLLEKHNIDRDTQNIINFPIWAFVEVISFGTLISFWAFYYTRLGLLVERKVFLHLFKQVKQVRNAAAHNSCMLNNLCANRTDEALDVNYRVTRFLGSAGVGAEMRKSKLSNELIYQVVTTIYAHDVYVTSSGIRANRSAELHDLVIKVMPKNGSYFEKNALLTSSYDLIRKISDYLVAKNPLKSSS